MFVNAQLIRNKRLKRAWSQEHLAQTTGLGLRTVQRIESDGNASLETVKALAEEQAFAEEGISGELPKRSWVKISQIRTLSVKRIGQRLTRISPEEMNAIIEGLNEIVGSTG